MIGFTIVTHIAQIFLFLLPKRISNRIRENAGDLEIFVLRTNSLKTKQRMTLIEGFITTLLFDLALFGTSNWFINGFIVLFTKFQNGWDRPFRSSTKAKTEITEFCTRLNIQMAPWIWEKDIENYTCLNDFFTRKYAPEFMPKVGNGLVVSPACCTIKRYSNNDTMKYFLVKGCEYKIENIGLNAKDIDLYKKNDVVIGYLSPSDYHRVHSPIEGKCIHCKLEGANRYSTSVKYFDGKFNILNENKRLVVVIEASEKLRVAIVIIGGIGVNTIVFDPSMEGRQIAKGDELSTFRGGGSAFAMFSTILLPFVSQLDQDTLDRPVEVLVGESLTN